MATAKRIFQVEALFDGAGRFVEGAEVFVENGIVAKILSKSDDGEAACAWRRDHSHLPRIALPDGLMLPGLINAHHHAYSALARGMPVTGSMENFPRVLESLWWRLDRALDPEAVRLSGLVTALACIRRGVTAVVDHHSSPSCVRGSLDALAGAFGALSMSSVLCFETSDRNGARAFDDAVAENLDFCARHEKHAFSRGLFGLHAGFTLSRASLERLAREIPDDLPVHVHAAEDRCDADHARAEGFAGALDRLAKLGVLRRRSLLAHGVHLAPEELALVEATDAFVVLNPESNANNAVGTADPDRLPETRLLLGTDGMSSDVLGAARFAFLTYKALGGGGRDPLALVRAMLFDNPSSYLSALFRRPVGRIAEGAPADFAIFDYTPPTPLGADNLLGHLVFGFAPTPEARWVYANGVSVLEAGRITALDEGAALAAAREASSGVWRRYRELKP
jgi:cytosine/adenosine deaminase-related metal-dependent hydrolase